MTGPFRATVLVVDDEEGIRRSVGGLLADEGYQAVPAEDAEAALASLEREEPDLALVDILLPGTDGMELLARLRRERGQLPVIMMSGHATVDLAVRATRMGAYDFLEKPLDPAKLLLTIRHVLEHVQLRQENLELRRSMATDVMVGRSPEMEELREAISRAAPSSGRVLVMGENGTGKELVARALHAQSRRRDGPFVKMNCAAIPRDLIESELFGHEKGAFTGALRMHRGRFELAHRGTLLLDEVGDMSLEVQAKLLRVLEEGEVEHVGGTKPIMVDVRVVAATNKDISREIVAGRFREDLFYRLSVIPLRVPPLRERREDIPLLARHFLELFSRENNRRPRELLADALPSLTAHPWPGNVRELKNLTERLVIMGEGTPITREEVEAVLITPAQTEAAPALSPAGPAGPAPDGEPRIDPDLPLREKVDHFETALIRQALEDARWNVSEAAKKLRTDRANLHRKMKRLGIGRPAEEAGEGSPPGES